MLYYNVVECEFLCARTAPDQHSWRRHSLLMFGCERMYLVYVNMYVYIYIYIYTCICINTYIIYIYIYIEREREINVYIYIYIYIHMYSSHRTYKIRMSGRHLERVDFGMKR